jgi:uncharacterized membrane protein YeaQ/YmgE (transglycosylase-associated protein family)
MFTLAHLATWIAVGLIGGSLAGLVATRQRSGFGLLTNVALGCAGAMVGGAVFGLFGLFPNLESIAISLRDVVAAFVGSLIVLAAIWLWGLRKRPLDS